MGPIVVQNSTLPSDTHSTFSEGSYNPSMVLQSSSLSSTLSLLYRTRPFSKKQKLFSRLLWYLLQVLLRYFLFPFMISTFLLTFEILKDFTGTRRGTGVTFQFRYILTRYFPKPQQGVS